MPPPTATAGGTLVVADGDAMGGDDDNRVVTFPLTDRAGNASRES